MYEITAIWFGSLIKMTTPSRRDAVRFYSAIEGQHAPRLWIIANKRRYLVR